MKAFTTLALTVAIAGSTFSVQANPHFNEGLALCKTEIHDLYGEEAELALVDMRHNMSGSSMRIAARLDADNSRFVTCWVPRQENDGAVSGRDGSRLASTSPEGVKP